MDTYNDGGDSSELGAQKETFKNRLSKAIDNPLTLENTDTYVDDALGAVINLGWRCSCRIRRPAGC